MFTSPNAAFRPLVLAVALLLLSGCNTRPSVEADLDIAAQIREQLESGASSVTAAVSADPVGWATVRGTVRMASAPERKPLTLSGDDAPICSANGTLLSEDVVAGPNGELSNVLVIISSKIPTDRPGWVHPDYANPPAVLEGSMGFDQKNCVFLSHLYAFQAGQKIQILNSDPIGHNTNISGGQAARAFNQLVSAGAKAEYDPGGACNLPMSVSCNIHPWMKAYMMVSDHPYFAVTGEDGSFELKNVPAGVELEVRAWHEMRVDFSDGDGDWKRGRRKLTLQDGQSMDLTVNVTLK